MNETPQRTDFREMVCRLHRVSGVEFWTQFLELMLNYDENDVFLAKDLPRKYWWHIEKELHMRPSKWASEDNYKFLLSLACVAGGNLFK